MNELRKKKHNKKCIDCDVENRFGSPVVVWRFRTFVCSNCAEAHKQLWAKEVKIITEYTWSEMELAALQKDGNKEAKKVWYGKYDKTKGSKPKPGDSSAAYLEFIKKVYVKKAFYFSKEQQKKLKEKKAAEAKAKAQAKADAEKPLMDTEEDLMDHDDHKDFIKFADGQQAGEGAASAAQTQQMPPQQHHTQMVMHPLFSGQPLGVPPQPQMHMQAPAQSMPGMPTQLTPGQAISSIGQPQIRVPPHMRMQLQQMPQPQTAAQAISGIGPGGRAMPQNMHMAPAPHLQIISHPLHSGQPLSQQTNWQNQAVQPPATPSQPAPAEIMSLF